MTVTNPNFDDEYVQINEMEYTEENNEQPEVEVAASATTNSSSSAATDDNGLILGAAAIGALTGLILGGPRTGVVAGAGLGAAAMMDAGSIGDAARAVGGVGVETGKKVQEIDKKHGIVENTKSAAQNLWNQAQELNEKHQIVEKTKQTAVSAYESTREFERKHHIFDKLASSVTKGANAISEKLRGENETGGLNVTNENRDLYPGSRNNNDADPSQNSPVQKLIAMGFEKMAVIDALNQTNNDVEAATVILLGD